MLKRYPCWIPTLVLTAATLVGVAAQEVQEAPEVPEVQPWVHVQIDGQEGENAEINLPIAVLKAVLSMAPETVVTDGQVRVGQEHGISVSALREMWQQILSAGDAEFITVEEADRTVRVARVGELIEIRVDGSDGTARADLPVVVVDALLSGEGDNLNIAAAVAEMKNLRGDIIHISEDRRQIRVWIDEVAQQQ